jgi:hypothetical protein
MQYTHTDSSTHNKGEIAMSAVEDLDLDQINEIMAAGREKGIYKDDMVEFAQANKLGQTYPFQGKKAQSVKTGFESAKEAIAKDENLDEDVKTAVANTVIRVRNDAVYLIRNDLVKQAKQAQASS